MPDEPGTPPCRRREPVWFAGGMERIDRASSASLVLMWSSGFIGAELGTRTALPMTVLAWRFVALAVVLLAACLVLRVRTNGAAVRRQVALGLLAQVAYLGLIFTGVRLGVPPGVAALIAALQPMLVATVAGPLLGEHTRTAQRIGLLLGLVGVALVVRGDVGITSAPWWAYLLPVAGMLALSSATVLERRWRPTETLLQVFTIQAVLSALAFSAIALATGALVPPSAGSFWVAVLWLVVLSSLGGYGSYVFVARRQGATRVSTLLYLTPPTTMLVAFVMFGDPVPLLGVVGLLVSGAGVFLVLRGRGAATPPPPPAPGSPAAAGTSRPAPPPSDPR